MMLEYHLKNEVVNKKVMCFYGGMTVLKKIREKAGLSQRKFAERLATDQAYIGKLELNKTTISAKTLKKIAHEFGEEPEALLISYGYFPDYTAGTRWAAPEIYDRVLRRLDRKIRRNLRKAKEQEAEAQKPDQTEIEL